MPVSQVLGARSQAAFFDRYDSEIPVVTARSHVLELSDSFAIADNPSGWPASGFDRLDEILAY